MHRNECKTQPWVQGKALFGARKSKPEKKLGLFVLKRSLWTVFLGPFQRAETTYKFHQNSKNLTIIANGLNVRESPS